VCVCVSLYFPLTFFSDVKQLCLGYTQSNDLLNENSSHICYSEQLIFLIYLLFFHYEVGFVSAVFASRCFFRQLFSNPMLSFNSSDI
jgi:hypothetical protein